MNAPTPSVLIKISPYRFFLAALLGLIALQQAHAIVVNSRFARATTNAEAASFSQLMASSFSNVVRLSINNSGVCTGTLISAGPLPSWATSCPQLWDGDVLGSTVTVVGTVIRDGAL